MSSNKDWSVFLADPSVVLTCQKCKKYKTYTNPDTTYRYRWCRYCMKQEVLGPFKHQQLGTYTPEKYQRARRRAGLSFYLPKGE